MVMWHTSQLWHGSPRRCLKEQLAESEEILGCYMLEVCVISLNRGHVNIIYSYKVV